MMKIEKIRTYCIVGMDNVKGLDSDIQSIAIGPAKLIIGQKQVGLIGVFKTKLTPDRIKDVLNIGGDRTFFISELNPATFSAHIDRFDIQEMFFGEFDRQQKEYVKIKKRVEDYLTSGGLMSIVKSRESDDIPNFGSDISLDYEYDEEKLSSLSVKERSELMDKLLTDVDKLSDNEKKALSFLASL